MSDLPVRYNPDFIENAEPRCPCILLLDTSGSMSGEKINALNEGLRTFKEDLMKDHLAPLRVEVAVVTFDSAVNVVQDFVTANGFNPPTLTAQGSTHMGAAVQKALDMVQTRKEEYRANEIAYYRPWVFMITDGEPQGESDYVVQQAANRITDAETNNHAAFFAVAVEGANIERLRQIAVVREPSQLKGLDFRELFLWLSASMRRVSQSKIGEKTELPPAGWSAV